jgi:predicted metal-dependent HD superfamily phosphohydrolase
MTDGFGELLRRLPVAEAVRADLRRRLCDPARAYHGRAHVALLWRRHRRFGRGLPVTAEPWDTRLACAIAFHDAVWKPGGRDNEAASAALWRHAGAALDRAGIDWVADTILATADHLGATQPPGLAAAAWQARLWMLDLDLTPLGEPPHRFAANASSLRREAAHLPVADYEAGRLGFLAHLAAAPALYRSARLARAFAAQARANLARELAVA